ncbi:N-acetylglucosamine-1-phosphodiester alpha-N-acetylglucosaminidase [Pogona vitticeps]
MAASIERRLLHERRRGAAGAVLVWSLFCPFLGAQGSGAEWNSLNDDLLMPYSPPNYGLRHRHRSLRDCQALLHGNTTHVSWHGDNSSLSPPAVTRGFVSYIPPEGRDRRPVYGHITVVADPLRTFSVLEPGGPGGCPSHNRATVEEMARRGKCLVAQNGGYFNTDTGKCLGNVISDGRLVQTSGGVQNAQFGIRKDGTLVFGYLSEEEVLAKENPFVQLVSGVVWLLRDGEVYVNQSWAVECDETQETGTFDKFVNTMSARTAVGHDKQGRLVLAHMDGQTESRGVNLWEMAEFLKKQDVVNAINLDGGGSATLVLNGTLASYPSDHCAFNAMWRCPRSVSTILCVHDPLCEPPDCSGHGRCERGRCRCEGPFWRGAACDVLDCGPSNCSLHGICTEEGCVCDAGWTGADCSEGCPNGTYGDGCAHRCLCLNAGRCDPVHGSCACPDGYRGPLCEEACPLGWYGPGCLRACRCPNQCPCDQKTGSCNASSESPRMVEFARAGQCLLGTERDQEHFLAGKVWLGITSVLLLLSAALNLKHFFCQPTGRGDRGTYTYHPLQEMNGETAHSCPSAAWEKEEEGGDP